MVGLQPAPVLIQARQQRQRQRTTAEASDERGGPQHDIGMALILVVGVLILLPGSFSYYILVNALREQNLCHVGPIAGLQPHPKLDHAPKFFENRESLHNLYGTYTTFDDAIYYFVKTPYEIAPQVLPDYGYWSISTLALTLLSPKLRQTRQDEWKLRDEENRFYDMETAPAIQWDQSHQIDFKAAQQQNEHKNARHSSQSNRWCLVNHQDPNMYRHKNEEEEAKKLEEVEANDMNSLKYQRPIFGSNNKASTVLATDLKTAKDEKANVFRICAPPQTSILSSGDQAPYFVELPLQPPLAGRWRKFETDDILTSNNDDDDGEENSDYARYRRRRKPTNPYQINVQCHVRDMDLSNLAHGSLQPDAQPHLGWEHAARILLPQWNVFYLPGTLAVLLGLLLVQLRKRPRQSSPQSSLSGRRNQQQQRFELPESMHNDKRAEEWNLVRAAQNIWLHDSWRQWALTSIWVYLLGTCLEPLVGTVPYFGIIIAFLQLVAILVVPSSDTANTFLWVCFGQSILLAQLEPSLAFGQVEMSSISMGDSTNALQINVLNVLVGLVPILQSPIIPWRSVAGCIIVGWCLSKPLTMELLGAPQWTVPTILLSHLWWKLTQLQDDTDLKKTDEEMVPFCDADHLSVISDDGENSVGGLSTEGLSDAAGGQSTGGLSTDEESAFSFTTTDAVVLSTKEKCFKIFKFIGVYVIFTSWFALTIGCAFTMDWTLVVGNMMTLWLCVGTNQFPRHPIWALYHMVASSILIIINSMTVVGWFLCHVTISTRALHALPPKYVYVTMGLQTLVHFVALLHTVRTKKWESTSSRAVPGHYFWQNIRIVGEEIRLWYHVFF